IYGLQPWPCATMELGGTTVKVFSAAYSDRTVDRYNGDTTGKILSAGKQGIEVVCGDGHCLFINELQAPGKKRMSAADYLRGHPLNP
ncbi:MAG: methionyl-tRNA formyltransferase, partial [Oscillospiraceae bacterium]|nr:methionyl-tRNA formyltransferase [Oscillospiraceae bacterium]